MVVQQIFILVLCAIEMGRMADGVELTLCDSAVRTQAPLTFLCVTGL